MCLRCRYEVVFVALLCGDDRSSFVGMKTVSHNSERKCRGEKIRTLRIGLDCTQEKMAAMSNMSVRTLQRAEKSGFLRLESVASLAAALNAYY